MENILQRRQKTNREVLLSDYGRDKLLTYADTFREMSSFFPREQQKAVRDKREVLEDIQLRENGKMLADNMQEVSAILSRIAAEVFTVRQLPPRTHKQVVRALRAEKICVRDIFYYKHDTGKDANAVCLNGYTVKKRGYAAKELADMLSVLLNRRLIPAVGGSYRMTQEASNFYFVEEPTYHVLTGTARATKQGEKASGDSFSIFEKDSGQVVVILSDGMGSGEKAGKESGQVVELMEYFLEAGYQLPTALNLVNSSILTAGMQKNMSTLDICSLDLYSGICEFRKAGGATSYIKSGRYVEEIETKTLPLGIFGSVEAEAVQKELSPGDYIVLLTDGIRNSLIESGNEQLLSCYISELQEKNPSQMAQMIMQFAIHACAGRVEDDMLVIVVGMFGRS